MEFSFFADENIGSELIEWLKQQEYRTTSVKEEKLTGSSDEDIIAKCDNEKLIIITQDSDFGKIIHTKEISFYVIIYLRPGHLSGGLHVASMQKVLSNKHLIQPCSLITCERKLNKITIRFRKIKSDDYT
jgi:predicted nuclease of predicted toxin-antitoxin system